MQKVIYNGIFFNQEQILHIAHQYGLPLSKIIIYPHITLKFHPSEEDNIYIEKLIGKKVYAIITKYGNNGLNEGFYVSDIIVEDEKIKTLFHQIESQIPHITISVCDEIDIKSKKTKSSPVMTYLLFNGSNQDRVISIPNIIIEGIVGEYKQGTELTKEVSERLKLRRKK